MGSGLRVLVLGGVAGLAFLLMVSPASAHVPQFATGGTTFESATAVEQPSNSWVYYGTLDTPNEARYYRLDLKAGDRLHVQLLTPHRDPLPGLAVMGPGFSGQRRLPSYVEAPAGLPVLVLNGIAGDAEYEPFTPGAYWYPATVDTQVPEDGSYYVAVYSDRPAGPFAIAVGYREKYTIAAWLGLPADLLKIYAWEDGWVLVLLPGIFVLIVGGVLVFRRVRKARRRSRTSFGLSGLLGLAAGIFCLTTSMTVLVQMIRAATRSGPASEMLITAFFILGPAVVGGLLLWLGWRTREGPGIEERIGMLVLGLAGLGLLAGYFVGPALAVLAAFAPPYQRRPLGAEVPVGRVIIDGDVASGASTGTAGPALVIPSDGCEPTRSLPAPRTCYSD